MKLRQKTLYLVGGTLLVLLLIIAFIVTRQSLRGFERLEQHSLTRDMERVTNTLTDESEELAVNARPWANWDETIAFVQGTQPDYDETYSMDSTVPQGMGVQFALFTDNQGNIAYTKEFLDTGAVMPTPELLSVFEDYLTRDPENLEEVIGILELPSSLALFAAVPILNNEATGPAAGSMIVAKYVSEAYLAELAEQTRLSPQVYLGYETNLPTDVAEVKEEVLRREDITALVKPLDSETVVAYATLHDVNNKNVGIVRIEEPRTIYQQGMQQLRLLLVSLFVVGVVFIAFIFALLELTILSRLSRLSQHVREITENGHGTRLEVSGKDELGMLATDLNGMLRVIDERTQALEDSKQELERSNLELLRSNQELERFAYVASHDLQEPLRKVQTFSDRLSSKYGAKLGEDGELYLSRMQESLGRMRSLIQDLLVYSRVQANKKDWVAVDLNEVVKEVISDLEVRLEQSGGRVIVERLPVIQGNPLQMRQVFQNLISNALKFSKPDQQPVVKVSAQQTADTQEIVVMDNGIGFEQQYAGRIFEVFQRLHTRGSYDGTGIGLAIVKKILEQHGGDIRAESEPGQGATFILKLSPLQQAYIPPTPRAAEVA
jgi:signal transduction histidine kinase